LFFKKKTVQRDDDRIWMTADLKWNGIINDISTERSENVFILVVTHFKKTTAELKKQFQLRGLNFEDYESHSHFGQWETETKNQPVLIMAENISELEGAIRQVGESKRVLVLVAEHYPLPEGDEALFSFLSNLPCSSTIRFHSALDEPFFKMFGGDRISNVMKMLETLGQGEKEYISHPLVTSAIQKAQKDIKKKATGDNKVDSMEEWFQYNLISDGVRA
jgi:preprotein translocase subunit SecA